MKAVVRDDIISLNSYVAAEFKYKKYLYMLMKAGNYCFLDQFKKLVPSGQAIIAGMIDNNLVATENINKNYKYVYLTDTAMKYLYLRDSDEDYSKIQKNRISVKKVSKNPSEKQLLSSAYKFHLLANDEELVDKESILKALTDFMLLKKHNTTEENYYKWIEKNNSEIERAESNVQKLNNEILSNKELIKRFNNGLNIFNCEDEINKLNKLKNEYREIDKLIKEKSDRVFKNGLKELNYEADKLRISIESLENIIELKNKALKNYKNIILEKENEKNDISNKIQQFEARFNKLKMTIEEKTLPSVKKVGKKFETLYNISKVIARVRNNTLEFIILDTGNFKTAHGYLKQINEIKDLNIGFEGINIIIYSFAENRAKNLYNEFIKAKESKEKALKTIKKYNIETNNSPTKSDFYIAAEKIYDNTPEFNIEIRDECYYMKNYKELISSSTKSIKRKDKKAIDDLIKKLNSK